MCGCSLCVLSTHRLGATVSVLHRKCVQKEPIERCVAEVLVRKVPENQQFIDIKVAVLGNVEAGKSTLLGVLTQGELDNGRGRARLNLFRHLHEIQTGRTSSISQEILGFNSNGEVGSAVPCGTTLTDMHQAFVAMYTKTSLTAQSTSSFPPEPT